jgi:hypothetical protein
MIKILTLVAGACQEVVWAEWVVWVVWVEWECNTFLQPEHTKNKNKTIQKPSERNFWGFFIFTL